MKKIKVGIIGGTGYSGVELLRLLALHPNIDIELITSRSEAGKPVAELFPSLSGFVSLAFIEPNPQCFAKCDLVFSATPNGIAMQHAQGLLEQGVRLIDLAADFRLKDIATWQQWYGMEHCCPELVAGAVYGLPELNRDKIRNAAIVANPGCYPTATSLALLPLVKAGLVNVGDLIADVKSGVTGAGRGASVATLFSEVNDSFKAYSATGHRHQPETSVVLSGCTEQIVGLTFIPHLVPMLRGIHATVYANLLDQTLSLEKVHEVFVEAYQDEPFVEVLAMGTHPETRSVKGSNMCRIAVHKATSTGKLVVLSVIDNLTKGAAGQAVQNMNIMFGFDEQLALQLPAVSP